MTAAWINELNSSNSKLHKEYVLKKALTAATVGSENAQMFLTLTSMTYNNFLTFGVKQIPETKNIDGAENPWGEFKDLLYKLHTRGLTGNVARDAIAQMSLRFDSDEWNTFAAPVLRRDLRAGFSETTMNKICKGTPYEIPKFSCQLASDSEDRPEMKGNKRLEPKLDGTRVLMVMTSPLQITSFSRNGKVYQNFSHIEHELAQQATKILTHPMFSSGVVFDGEVTSASFQELMKQARRKNNADASDAVFNVFDVIPLSDFTNGFWNASLRRRLSVLHSTIKPSACVQFLPHIDVDLDTAAGKDQLERYAKDIVAAGFEGVMIKDYDAPYECSRNMFWMKFKPVHDYDLVVIGVEEGTGRNKGRLGALVGEGTDQGRVIRSNVGSGFSDAQRDEIWAHRKQVMGQTFVAMADAVTKSQGGTYSLRFPRFKTFRIDK